MDTVTEHRSASAPKSQRRRGRWSKIAVALTLGAMAVYLYRALDLQESVRGVLLWVEGLGFWAPLAFIVIYILACVFLVPGSVLTLGAGAIFGLVRGAVYVSVASTAGATAAFLIARYIARSRVARSLEQRPRFVALDEAVANEGWKIVALTRLSPVFPFTLLNYAFGLTRIPLLRYILASWAGMIPGTIMYVYIGSVAGDLVAIDRTRPRSVAEWFLIALGLAATVVVTLLITGLARRALNEKGT